MGHQGRSGGRIMQAPTIERGRRCQNCRHFNNGVLAIQHYKAKRMAELNAKAAEIFERGPVAGKPLPVGLTGKRLGDFDPHSKPHGKDATVGDFSDIDAKLRALGLNYELGDQMMREGRLGICMIGVPAADFVEFSYFCGTRYEPKVVVDGAEKPDETPEEAKERLGYDKDPT